MTAPADPRPPADREAVEVWLDDLERCALDCGAEAHEQRARGRLGPARDYALRARRLRSLARHLAALRAAPAGEHPDTARLDWLSRQWKADVCRLYDGATTEAREQARPGRSWLDVWRGVIDADMARAMEGADRARAASGEAPAPPVDGYDDGLPGDDRGFPTDDPTPTEPPADG